MKIRIAVCLMIIWIPVLGMSADFNVPNRFQSGNEIKAREFNENYEAIEEQINTLRRELDSIKSKMYTKSWGAGGKLRTEKGSATKWANLPTEMALPITTGKSTLFIMADISRVQHTTANKNTEFRIIIEDTKLVKNQVAWTNTGHSQSWAFAPVTMHGATTVEPGDYTVRVQYRTQGGTVIWFSDPNGRQFRRLTVLEVPVSGARPRSK